MKKQTLGHRPRRVRLALPLLGVALAALAYLAWAGLRQGAAPAIVLEPERPAFGRSASVVARFAEPGGGLGTVRLELIQGERTVLLGECTFPRAGAFSPWRGSVTPETAIESSGRRSSRAASAISWT